MNIGKRIAIRVVTGWSNHLFCSHLRGFATRKGFLSLAAKMRRTEHDAVASRKLAGSLEQIQAYGGPVRWRPFQAALGKEELSNPIAVVWGNVFSVEMKQLIESLKIPFTNAREIKKELLSVVKRYYVAADDFKVLANNKERALIFALEKAPKTIVLDFNVTPLLVQLRARIS